MNSETKIYQIPEFTGEHIPVKEAARIMGKDSEYIRLGLIEGFLPIGSAYKRKGSSVYTYYISPRLFWEYTGYVYKRTKADKGIYTHLLFIPRMAGSIDITGFVCLY